MDQAADMIILKQMSGTINIKSSFNYILVRNASILKELSFL